MPLLCYGLNAIAPTVLSLVLLVVPIHTCAYDPNLILLLLYYGVGDPGIIASGMRSLGIPFFDGNMFRKVIMYGTKDLVSNYAYFLKAYSDIHISCVP